MDNNASSAWLLLGYHSLLGLRRTNGIIVAAEAGNREGINNSYINRHIDFTTYSGDILSYYVGGRGNLANVLPPYLLSQFPLRTLFHSVHLSLLCVVQ
jgi:hypothetical protein